MVINGLEARRPAENGSSNLHCTLWAFGRENVKTQITPSVCSRQARFIGFICLMELHFRARFLSLHAEEANIYGLEMRP